MIKRVCEIAERNWTEHLKTSINVCETVAKILPNRSTIHLGDILKKNFHGKKICCFDLRRTELPPLLITFSTTLNNNFSQTSNYEQYLKQALKISHPSRWTLVDFTKILKLASLGPNALHMKLFRDNFDFFACFKKGAFPMQSKVAKINATFKSWDRKTIRFFIFHTGYSTKTASKFMLTCLCITLDNRGNSI